MLPIAGGEQTRLLWRKSIVIRSILLGRLLAPLTDRVKQALAARVIDDMTAEAVRASGRW